MSLSPLPSLTLTHPLSHLRIHSLTHSPTHRLTQSPTHPLIIIPPHSLPTPSYPLSLRSPSPSLSPIIYINDIDVGLNNFISKFADDTKIGNSIITEHFRMSLQEDLRKISEWSQRWEIPFNVNKCHILQVRTRNQKTDYKVNGTKLESVHCVKDLGVKIACNLISSQQCTDPAGKTNRMLSFINRSFSFKTKDVILPLYISLVRLYLEYAVQFWAPHYTKGIAKLEAVQRRATKMITSLRNKSYEEWLARLNLFSLEKRRLRGKIIECFKIFKGFTNVDASKMFSIDNPSQRRKNRA